MWFEQLTGFREINPEQVRQNLEIDGNVLISLVNGKQYHFGELQIPTLSELKQNAPLLESNKTKIRISEVVGDVQLFHKDMVNRGALFQAASQFNLLEMVGPHISPERGVGIYENDRTQGPACAIACGAGTIYRNYFVEVNGQTGQTESNQIDCLEEIGKALDNEKLHLWKMKNGYALPNTASLQYISNQINQLTPEMYEDLKGKLKIGVQWNTEVTISDTKQQVTQVYCSALPVAYSNIESNLWKDFAKLILEATYEATFYTALKNFENTGNNRVYLTLVGGGAFGNDYKWISDAIRHAVSKFRNAPLDVMIVSYGKSNPAVRELVESIRNFI